MLVIAVVMIGVDLHKASHTAVVISAAEEPLGQLRVLACVAPEERLQAWAHPWPSGRGRSKAPAGRVTCWPTPQLLSAGERVLDGPPKLAARVRLLATRDINKNDPNDARSVAVDKQAREPPSTTRSIWPRSAALRSGTPLGRA